jgi:hypothetical protein
MICTQCENNGHLVDTCLIEKCQSCGEFHTRRNPEKVGCTKSILKKPQPKPQRRPDERNQSLSWGDGVLRCLSNTTEEVEVNAPPDDPVGHEAATGTDTLASTLADAADIAKSLASASIGSAGVADSLVTTLSQAAIAASQLIRGTGYPLSWTLTEAGDLADYLGITLREISTESNVLAQTVTTGMATTNSLTTTLMETAELADCLQTTWMVVKDTTEEFTTTLLKTADVAGTLGPTLAATAEVANHLTSSLITATMVADTLAQPP